MVASWDNTFGRTDLLPQVLAHECGHYLGLWHSMENLAACTTAGQANCSLWGGVDNLTDPGHHGRRRAQSDVLDHQRQQ